MEGENVLSPGSVLWKIVFTDKKIPKAQIKAFDICSALADAHIQGLELRKAGMLLRALAKVFSRKMKLLLEDCTAVLQIICREKHVVVHAFRTPSSKPITLGLESGNLYISDDMLDLDDETALPHDELSLLENDTAMGLDADFSNIEQVRESTLLSNSNIIPNSESTFMTKRRRTIEDSIAEYDLDVFREGTRPVPSTASRQEREDIQNRLRPTICIDPKILSMLRIAEKDVDDAVETKRQSSSLDDLVDNAFSIDAGDDQVFNQSDATRDSTAAEHGPLFDTGTLPKSFLFDTIVGDYSRFERACCFGSLLAMASRNEIVAEQDTAFGSIRCTAV